MMSMSLAEAAVLLDARYAGPGDRCFTGVSTDTRTLAAENLFFALTGPRFDGHDHVAEAQARGAAAAAVSRPVDCALPLLQVEDTRRALGDLARQWRDRFAIPVVGITGSNGKTTVKEMLAAILAAQGPVLATQGNLNNDIGVPLTLARLAPEHRSAVIEMGANHAGEIAYLAQQARPTVAIVTNAGPAHLEGFGSLEGVARAKGELFAGLDATAVAVINADDRFAPLWRDLARDRAVLSFGLDAPADVTARYATTSAGTQLELETPQGSIALCLPLLGRHNARNALGAAAAALAAGADLAHIRTGLEGLTSVAGRLQRKRRVDGGLVIDDTYNANPASLQAAIDVLRELPGERWLVFGDMAELGSDAAALHAEVGSYARAAGIERLFSLGDLARQAALAFGGTAFDDFDALLSALRSALRTDVSILVKGSRRMGMERVVQALIGAGVGGQT